MISGISIALRTFGAELFAPKAIPRSVVFFLVVTVAVLVAFFGGWIDIIELKEIRQRALFPGVPLLALALSDLPLREAHTRKTLLYLVISRVPRSTLAWVRTLGAAALSAGVLSFIVVLITACVGDWSLDIGRQILAIALGSALYTTFFGVVQLIFRRGIFAGVLFYFLLDVPLARISAHLRTMAPSWHLRVLAGPSFTSEVALLGTITPNPELAVLVLVGGTLLCGTLILWLFTRRDLGDLC